MEQVVEKFVIYQIRKKIIESDEREKYVYAYMVFIEQLINIFIALLMGIITKNVDYVISFIVAYMCLRTFGGGHHAKTPQQCCIVSAGIIITICFLKNYNLIHEVLINFLLCLCNIIIILYAPEDSKNKLLNRREHKINKTRTIIVLAIEYAAIGFFRCFDIRNIYLGIKLAILYFTIFLIIGKVINSIERKKNCEQKRIRSREKDD